MSHHRKESSMRLIVPTIQCLGIKTQLVPAIRPLLPEHIAGRWIEPFCGSGVVAFNVHPERALLCDTNRHIICLYTDIQTRTITPGIVKEFLQENGARLRELGEAHYYAVRAAFNTAPNSLAFL